MPVLAWKWASYQIGLDVASRRPSDMGENNTLPACSLNTEVDVVGASGEGLNSYWALPDEIAQVK